MSDINAEREMVACVHMSQMPTVITKAQFDFDLHESVKHGQVQFG